MIVWSRAISRPPPLPLPEAAPFRDSRKKKVATVPQIQVFSIILSKNRKYNFISNNFFLSLQLSTLPNKGVTMQVLPSLIFGFPFVRLYKVLF